MFRPTKEAPPPAGIRLFKLELDVFRNESERAHSERALQILLEALTAINLAWMKTHPPGTPLALPPIYKSGVIYTREALGSDERWQDARSSLLRMRLDCEDGASWLAAEMQLAGKNARAFASHKQAADGGSLYHVRVRVPGEGIYDPSRVLGMLAPDGSEGQIGKRSGQPLFNADKAFVPEFPGAKPDPRWSGTGMSQPGMTVRAHPLAVGAEMVQGCGCGGCVGCATCSYAGICVDSTLRRAETGAVAADDSLLKISEKSVPGPTGKAVRGVYRVRLADRRLFLSRESKSLAGLRSKWSWEDQGPLTFWHLNALGRLDLAPRFKLARPPGPAPAASPLVTTVKGKKVRFRPKAQAKAQAKAKRPAGMPAKPRFKPEEEEQTERLPDMEPGEGFVEPPADTAVAPEPDVEPETSPEDEPSDEATEGVYGGWAGRG